jgi:Domain of unknown function (DUF1707)
MMSGPGDQSAAAQHLGQLRASHADREQAIEQLKAAYVDDRLTKDEFDRRVGHALASRTHADLTAVISDLQARPAAARPAAAGPAAARPPSSPIRTLAKAARRSGVCLLVAFAILGVLAMTTKGDGGPSAFLAFCSVVMAVIAASGFLGYGVVDAWQEHRSRAQLPPRPRRNGGRLKGGQPSSTGRDPAPPGVRPDQNQTRADLRTRRPGHASIWPTPVGRSYTAEPAHYPV